MPSKIRNLLPVRLIALCFIYLIILGNIWFGLTFTGNEAPQWIQIMFGTGVLAVFGLGLVTTIYLVYLWSSGQLVEVREEDYETKLES